MEKLLIGLAVALLATDSPAGAGPEAPAAPAALNPMAPATPVAPADAVADPDPNDPVEREYQKLLGQDDAAQAEVDRWIREEAPFQAAGAALPQATLRARVRQRLEPVEKAYEEFLKRHPNHVRARLAYGSFLNDTGNEQGAVQQWDKARELDPKNPAAWNNLANHYGHAGPVKTAFECYAKAIELNPKEPVYYQNLATTVYLFRKDAQEYYQLNELQVFERALDLYRQALKLDPQNFLLASEYAQSYYGLLLAPTPSAAGKEKGSTKLNDQAIAAWEQALTLARDDSQRQGVYLHLARLKLNGGDLEAARRHLEAVSQEGYAQVKQRLQSKLEELQARKAAGPPPADPQPKPPAGSSTPKPLE
jgi:tetratricopeptide (TPR) repeat protein